MKIRAFTLWVVMLTLVLSVSAFAAPDHKQQTSQSSALQPVVKVDINKANLEDIEGIRGIGPALAERVIAYRNEHGKFKTPEELMNVKGIGQAKFDRIKEQLAV